MMFLVRFERYNNQVTSFLKRAAILSEQLGKDIDLWKLFSTRSYFIVEKLLLFELFSGDKSDKIDVWMIKVTIKTNQIDMDVMLISKVDNIQKPCLSLKSGLFPLVN